MNDLRDAFPLPDACCPCACCVRESLDAAGIAVDCTPAHAECDDATPEAPSP